MRIANHALLANLLPLLASGLHVRVGTRPSPLAVAQASAFVDSLRRADSHTTAELVVLDSTAEATSPRADVPLARANVSFTGVLDAAVADGVCDCAVHSLKDVPPEQRWCGGAQRIAWHSPRHESPLDVLVGAGSLAQLPAGARVGSSSLRRQAQLRALRPDLHLVNIRGNVAARLAALDGGEVDALVLARAGLARLGLDDRCDCVLGADEVLPAAGQGIVGAACRADDDATLALLRSADDGAARVAAAAERAVLGTVDGLAPWAGRPPVAALMAPAGDGWVLDALVARPDGSSVLRARRQAPAGCGEEEAAALGRAAGEELLRRAGAGFLR